jgi:hypothetical protein
MKLAQYKYSKDSERINDRSGALEKRWNRDTERDDDRATRRTPRCGRTGSRMTPRNADYSMYDSTFLTVSPGSVLFSRSTLLKRKDLCFSCLRIGLIRHRRNLRSSHLSSQVVHDFSWSSWEADILVNISIGIQIVLSCGIRIPFSMAFESICFEPSTIIFSFFVL